MQYNTLGRHNAAPINDNPTLNYCSAANETRGLCRFAIETTHARCFLKAQQKRRANSFNQCIYVSCELRPSLQQPISRA